MISPSFHCLRSAYIRSVIAVHAPRLLSISSKGARARIRAAAPFRFVGREFVRRSRDLLRVAACTGHRRIGQNHRRHRWTIMNYRW